MYTASDKRYEKMKYVRLFFLHIASKSLNMLAATTLTSSNLIHETVKGTGLFLVKEI